MTPPNEEPDSRDFREETLEDPAVVVDVCRRVLGVDEPAPLLIAADGLAKIKESQNVVGGGLNNAAVEALKYLALLSQTSVEVKNQRKARGEPPSAPCFIAASAYTAYNPAKGVIENSNRQVGAF